MDIKVGELVRPSKGKIFKVTEVNPTLGKEIAIVKNEYGYPRRIDLTKEKHNFNIIDLIKIEDIVNGYRILNIVNLENSDKKVFTICKSDFKDICRVWGEEDIETILTHEQYNQNCYKVR